MNVADSTPMSNPSSDPAETAEQLCQRIGQQAVSSRLRFRATSSVFYRESPSAAVV